MTEFEKLKEQCQSCTRCELCKTRTNVVFGTGNENAKIMFIGEAPGEKEDLSGIPFVGAAGKLFDKFLFAVGIDREDVYIANMLKCRPPKNRDPLPAEQDLCIEYLKKQIELIDPKLIVCLGRISGIRLIKDDLKITREHGVWYKKDGRDICAVYHPSLLLRDPRRKGEFLTDMEEIKRRLDKAE
ncbi:MAG: uracil-DNA glycosylase [Ruminococcaceae bacterium]|nr:uracil-DNA glycosylase [Oscillospiraceae bacterium]